MTKTHSFGSIVVSSPIGSFRPTVTRIPIGLALLLFLLVGCSWDPGTPDKENAQIYWVDIAPNGEEVAARHSFDFVTTRSVSTNEELCSWNTNWRTQEPLYTPSGELLLMDRLNSNPLTSLFGYSREFVFFDTKTCERVREFAVKGLNLTHSIEFSRNGEHILRSSVDCDKEVVQIQKIDSETGNIVHQWAYSQSYMCSAPLSSRSVALSGDGTTLVIGLSQRRSEEGAEVDRVDHHGRVILIDFESGEVVRDWIESDTVGISTLDISFDGKILVLGSRDGTVQTLHIPSDTSKSIARHSSSVDKLVISPSDELVFSWSTEEAERLVAHRLDTGEQVHEFQFAATIHDFGISPDGETLVVGTGSIIEVVNLSTKS